MGARCRPRPHQICPRKKSVLTKGGVFRPCFAIGSCCVSKIRYSPVNLVGVYGGAGLLPHRSHTSGDFPGGNEQPPIASSPSARPVTCRSRSKRGATQMTKGARFSRVPPATQISPANPKTKSFHHPLDGLSPIMPCPPYLTPRQRNQSPLGRTSSAAHPFAQRQNPLLPFHTLHFRLPRT